MSPHVRGADRLEPLITAAVRDEAVDQIDEEGSQGGYARNEQSSVVAVICGFCAFIGRVIGRQCG